MDGEKHYIGIGATAALLLWSALAHGQLRIASYNIAADVNGVTTPNPGTETVLAGIGNELVNGFARPLDILTLQEVTSNTATVAPLVDSLNAIYGPGTYAMGTLNGQVIGGNPSTGNGPNAVIFNTHTVQLTESTAFGTLSTSAQARQEMRYRFVPVGYDDSAAFYLYVGHYKASSGTTNMTRRNVEAQNTRTNASGLGDAARLIYTGDFNLTGGTSEPAWATLTAPGVGQAIDPLNGATSKASQTESTTSISIRFDFEFNTAPTMDSHGFSYINGSLHAFGHDGSITSGRAATDPSNKVFPDLPNRALVLNGLTTASDHYPVVADYRLPAKMGVSVDPVPSRVIVGSSVPVNVTVSNIAPVGAAIGADGLDYSLTAAGDLSGSGSGTSVPALAAGNSHLLMIDTSSQGVKSGTINAESSSQEVAGKNFSQPVSTTVLAHATPSFLTDSTANQLTMDFGIRARGSQVTPASFSIANRPDISGFTAGLRLDQINGAGATDKLSTDLAPTTIDPGASGAFLANLDTSSNGEFESIYTIKTSDEDVPGAMSRSDLSLVLRGLVETGGDSNMDGTVDGADLGILAAHWQGNGVWQDGDFNGDGAIDIKDLYMLANNWNSAPAGGSASIASALADLGLPSVPVPEPSSIILVAFSTLYLSRRALRRSINAPQHKRSI